MRASKPAPRWFSRLLHIPLTQGWSQPAADEEWQQGFYAEIQDLVECCASGRRPQSGATIAHDTVAALYAGYVSAERGGQDVPVPLAPLSDLE